MIASGFLLVLIGGVIFFVAAMKIVWQQLSYGFSLQWNEEMKKWSIISGVGLILVILGLLMAQTA